MNVRITTPLGLKAASPTDPDPQEVLRSNLRVLRRAAGLSQAAMAEVLGVYAPEVSDLETGTRGFTLKMAIKVARAFDTTVAELLVPRSVRAQ
jgi:putative transcriptional regulator